jgi:hypothetical protein
LDEKILYTMNKVLALFKAELYREIGDLFNSSPQFLCSFAEHDHYGPRSNLPYWGALFDSSFGEEFAWPGGAEFYSFAYLTSKIEGFERAVAAVANLPGFKLLHVPAADKNIIEQYRDRNDVVIKSEPVLLSAVFDRVDLVVHQGGMGVSAQCLLKGVPQVLIPTQTEQRMLARQMLSQNIGKAVDHHKNPSFDTVFQEALVDQELRVTTTLLQQKYAGFSQQVQIEKMVDEMLRIFG